MNLEVHPRIKKQWPEAQPCDHPGCLSHLTHPCEGCGRIGGRLAPPYYHRALDIPRCCGNCELFYMAASVCIAYPPRLPVQWDYVCAVHRHRKVKGGE